MFILVQGIAILLLLLLAVLAPGNLAEAKTLISQNIRNDVLDHLEMRWLGKKYRSESPDVRLRRLEITTRQTPPPEVSQHYRLARLQAYSQANVPEESQRLAVQAYNQGVDEAASGNIEAAVASYRNALHYNPRMIQAYNNLANLYEKMQRIDAAIQTYRSALRYAPKDPLLHRNLGVMYEHAGDVEKALEAFQTYLRLAPEDADPAIQSVVEEFGQKWRHGDKTAEYTQVATRSSEGKKLIWAQRLNPVPVYVHLEDPSQAVFLPILQESMATWEQASNSRLKFREVSTPKAARILITLREGPLAHPYLNVGHAQYQAENLSKRLLETLRVTIHINTGEQGSNLSLAQQSAHVKRLALHELGHAIGIWGHSANPRDIMYTHPIVSDLSERDRETIRRLYEPDAISRSHQ